MMKKPRRPLNPYQRFYREERARLLGLEIPPATHCSSQAEADILPVLAETAGDGSITSGHNDGRIYLSHGAGRERMPAKRKHRKSHGQFSLQQLSSHVSRAWKELDENIKNTLRMEYHVLLDQYKKDLAAYNKNMEREQRSNSALNSSPPGTETDGSKSDEQDNDISDQGSEDKTSQDTKKNLKRKSYSSSKEKNDVDYPRGKCTSPMKTGKRRTIKNDGDIFIDMSNTVATAGIERSHDGEIIYRSPEKLFSTVATSTMNVPGVGEAGMFGYLERNQPMTTQSKKIKSHKTPNASDRTIDSSYFDSSYSKDVRKTEDPTIFHPSAPNMTDTEIFNHQSNKYNKFDIQDSTQSASISPLLCATSVAYGTEITALSGEYYELDPCWNIVNKSYHNFEPPHSSALGGRHQELQTLEPSSNLHEHGQLYHILKDPKTPSKATLKKNKNPAEDSFLENISPIKLASNYVPCTSVEEQKNLKGLLPMLLSPEKPKRRERLISFNSNCSPLLTDSINMKATTTPSSNALNFTPYHPSSH